MIDKVEAHIIEEPHLTEEQKEKLQNMLLTEEDDTILDEDDTEDEEDTEDIEEPDDLGEDYDEDALNRGDFKSAFFNRCRDNSIEWYTGQTRITATFSQRKWINKIKRLAAKRPNEVEIVVENTDSIVVHMPIGYVKISPPKTVSAEQRERMRLQAQKNIAEGKFGRKKKNKG